MTEDEQQSARDYGHGEDGDGWVNTEMRERDEDAREFLLKVAIAIGIAACVLASAIWAATINPHIAGLNH